MCLFTEPYHKWHGENLLCTWRQISGMSESFCRKTYPSNVCDDEWAFVAPYRRNTFCRCQSSASTAGAYSGFTGNVSIIPAFTSGITCVIRFDTTIR